MDRDRRALTRAATVALPVVFLAVFFAWPLVAILQRSLVTDGALDIPFDVLASSSTREIAWFTLWQATASTALTLVAGLPLAWALSRFSFPGRSLVEALVLVPFVLPTVVVATAFIAFLPDGVERSVWAILLAHVFFNVAVVVRVVGAFWAGLDDRLWDAAATLGASPVERHVRVTLPLLAPALASAASIVFLFCFTSFGVIVVLGGIRYATLESEIYNQAARLFELLPSEVNELWQADVTYLHIPGFGWWYAVTVIDYFSRYLLALHLSPSNDAGALMVAVDDAIAEVERLHGSLQRVPILVTDNGSNFLARKFREHIDGVLCQVRTRYRTPQQLGLLERFHQTLKQEEIYWDIYRSPAQARDRLDTFRQRYNQVRPHWALRPSEHADPVTPADVYCRGVKVQIPRWQQWAREARAKLDAMLEQDAQAA